MGVRLGLTTDMNPKQIPETIPARVEVIALLLIDPSGRVSQGPSSRPLSSPEDRQRFLSLRGWGDCIVVGRRTWESESYAKTKVPVIVYSREPDPIQEWNREIERLQREHGPRIVVEAGPELLEQFLRAGVIDRLYLTRTSRISSDEESPRFHFDLLKSEGEMELIESVEGSEDIFEVYQRKNLSTR
ncbi:MAG: dihydrofolate reductase family protein [Actinomycetota bacterium]